MEGGEAVGVHLSLTDVVNVLRAITISWCQEYNKVLNSRFGFYPGRSTLQPVFILRHVQHAAKTLRPHGSPRLHAAFIDFKQATDCVLRRNSWQHLEIIGMPVQLFSNIKKTYIKMMNMSWWMERKKCTCVSPEA